MSQIFSQIAATPAIGHFPKSGIKLSHFRNILNLVCGDENSIEGLTTEDVCKRYIKPHTAARQCSVCDWLKETNLPAFHDTAEVFVSHAWQNKILEVLNALEYHFRNQPDIVIWFDIFSQNQHNASQLDFNWWSSTFRSAIKEFGYTVMVLAPWNNPLPLTRAWCLFELWSTAEEECRFEVAMSKVQQDEFIEDMMKDQYVIDKMLAKIDVEHSVATVVEDKENIFKEVNQSSGGFAALNSTVLGKMRDWVIFTVEETIKRTPDRLQLLNRLGVLHMNQGNYEKAEAAFVNCLEKIQQSSPDNNDPIFLSTLANFASLHHTRGFYEKAVTMFEYCLKKEKLIPGDFGYLTTMHNLASVFMDQGKYDQAKELFVECVDLQKTILGDNHPETLRSKHALGGLLHFQGHLKQAELLYQEVHKIQMSNPELGENHPTTLGTLDSLARVNRGQGNFKVAEKLFLDCLAKRRIKLGPKHQDTLQTLGNLAVLYIELGTVDGNIKQAHECAVECLEGIKSLKGNIHPETPKTLNNVAMVYMKQGLYEKAEPIFIECLGIMRKLVGENHPETLTMLNNLAGVYCERALYDKAIPLLVQCLETNRKILGDNHPETLDSMNNLAGLYFQQCDYNQSAALFLECLKKEKAILGETHWKTQRTRSNYNGCLTKIKFNKDIINNAIEFIKYSNK